MSIPNNELREKIQAIIKAWYGLDDCFRFAPSYFRDELGEKASAIDDALLDLEGILCKTGWISVNERLPEFSQYVLVYSVDKYDNQSDAGIEIDSYDTINDIWVESSSWERVVTHWMPLPPIPEDESWLNLCLKSHPANMPCRSLQSSTIRSMRRYALERVGRLRLFCMDTINEEERCLWISLLVRMVR